MKSTLLMNMSHIISYFNLFYSKLLVNWKVAYIQLPSDLHSLFYIGNVLRMSSDECLSGRKSFLLEKISIYGKLPAVLI